MKSLFKIISSVAVLVFAFPTFAFAEDNQKAPVLAEAECTVVNNITKEIQIKELKITEVASDAFSKGDVLSFCVRNMKFEKADTVESSDGVQNSVSVSKEGNLEITINGAKDSEVETITLSNVMLSANGLPVGTYSLRMILPDTENTSVPILDDFIQVTNINDEKVAYKFELKLGSNVMKVNDTEKQLRVPAYISKSGYTVLPLREITTAFPWTQVLWDQKSREATIIFGANIARITAGADRMQLNTKTVQLKNKAEIKDGRMFVSVRDLCRICTIPNEDIHWDNNTKTVIIDTAI